MERIESLHKAYEYCENGNLKDVLLEDKRQAVRQALSQIATGSYGVTTSDSLEGDLQSWGFTEGEIRSIREAQEEGVLIGGFAGYGRTVILADNIESFESLRRTYVHERQHLLSEGNLKDLSSEVSREEALDILRSFTEYAFVYASRKTEDILSEAVSYAMEEVYSMDIPAANILYGMGVENEKFINFIENLNNRQLSNANLCKSRFDSPECRSIAGDGLQVRDIVEERAGEVGRQAAGSVDGNQEGRGLEFLNLFQKDPEGEYPVLEPEYSFAPAFSITRNVQNTVSKWFDKWADNRHIPDEKAADAKRSFMDYVSELNGSSLQLATARWFTTGTVRIPEDQDKINQAVKVASVNRVDPLSYASPMSIIDSFPEFVEKANATDPHTVPTLHLVKSFPSGLEIFDVDDTQQSRMNMREIINTHFGKTCSPWCLLQGDGQGNLTQQSEKFWKHYNAYPKQVAFMNGHLVAFSANDKKKKVFWDRKDRSAEDVRVCEGEKYRGYSPVTGKLAEEYRDLSDETEMTFQSIDGYQKRNDRYEHIKYFSSGNVRKVVNGNAIRTFYANGQVEKTIIKDDYSNDYFVQEGDVLSYHPDGSAKVRIANKEEVEALFDREGLGPFLASKNIALELSTSKYWVEYYSGGSVKKIVGYEGTVKDQAVPRPLQSSPFEMTFRKGPENLSERVRRVSLTVPENTARAIEYKFYPNGQIHFCGGVIKGSYRSDEVQNRTVFYPDGKVQYRMQEADKGEYVEERFFPDGSKRYSFRMGHGYDVDTAREGIKYSESGQVELEIRPLDDGKTSLVAYWPNGKVKVEYDRCLVKKTGIDNHGIRRSYYETGELESETTVGNTTFKDFKNEVLYDKKGKIKYVSLEDRGHRYIHIHYLEGGAKKFTFCGYFASNPVSISGNKLSLNVNGNGWIKGWTLWDGVRAKGKLNRYGNYTYRNFPITVRSFDYKTEKGQNIIFQDQRYNEYSLSAFYRQNFKDIAAILSKIENDLKNSFSEKKSRGIDLYKFIETFCSSITCGRIKEGLDSWQFFGMLKEKGFYLKDMEQRSERLVQNEEFSELEQNRNTEETMQEIEQDYPVQEDDDLDLPFRVVSDIKRPAVVPDDLMVEWFESLPEDFQTKHMGYMGVPDWAKLEDVLSGQVRMRNPEELALLYELYRARNPEVAERNAFSGRVRGMSAIQSKDYLNDVASILGRKFRLQIHFADSAMECPDGNRRKDIEAGRSSGWCLDGRNLYVLKRDGQSPDSIYSTVLYNIVLNRGLGFDGKNNDEITYVLSPQVVRTEGFSMDNVSSVVRDWNSPAWKGILDRWIHLYNLKVNPDECRKSIFCALKYNETCLFQSLQKSTDYGKVNETFIGQGRYLNSESVSFGKVGEPFRLLGYQEVGFVMKSAIVKSLESDFGLTREQLSQLDIVSAFQNPIAVIEDSARDGSNSKYEVVTSLELRKGEYLSFSIPDPASVKDFKSIPILRTDSLPLFSLLGKVARHEEKRNLKFLRDEGKDMGYRHYALSRIIARTDEKYLERQMEKLLPVEKKATEADERRRTSAKCSRLIYVATNIVSNFENPKFAGQNISKKKTSLQELFKDFDQNIAKLREENREQKVVRVKPLELRTMKIQERMFTVKFNSMLKRDGITTYRQLMDKGSESIRQIYGPGALKQVVKAFNDMGYQLDGTPLEKKTGNVPEYLKYTKGQIEASRFSSYLSEVIPMADRICEYELPQTYSVKGQPFLGIDAAVLACAQFNHAERWGECLVYLTKADCEMLGTALREDAVPVYAELPGENAVKFYNLADTLLPESDPEVFKSYLEATPLREIDGSFERVIGQLNLSVAESANAVLNDFRNFHRYLVGKGTGMESSEEIMSVTFDAMVKNHAVTISETDAKERTECEEVVVESHEIGVGQEYEIGD